jgi:HEAT repeat protein
MASRIRAILNLQPGEEKNVFLMVAQYFFMGAAMLFVQSASLALFFTAWDSTAMPYIYLGIAVIVSTITASFLKISERTSLARFLVLCLFFLLAGSIAFRIGLSLTASKWLMLALPIWSQTLVNICMTAFWALAGNIFDVRQGKRIFGLMNAGSWLAYVVMGPFTTPLVNALGTENLYLVIAACLFIAFIFQQLVVRANPGTSARPEILDEGTQKASNTLLFRNRYILLIFALITLWRVSYFILDNVFYDRAALQYPSADELAGFIGSFFGLVGLLGFITDTFLTGRIVSRFGLRAGLLTTPTLTMLSMAALAVTGTMDPTLVTLLFWLSVAAKFTNEGLGFSLDQTSTNVLYQPIQRIRTRAQAFTEGIVQPLAIGLAGGLLLLFNTILKFNVIQLTYIYLAAAAAWIAVAVMLIRAYPVALTEALHKRRFGDKGILLTDLASIEVIQKAFKSPHPAEVLYALDLLERSESKTLKDDLIGLVDSPHPEVRKSVMERIERLKIADALPAIQTRLKTEDDPAVREAAARTLTVLGADRDELLKLLKHRDEAIQRGATVGLLHSQPFEDIPEAGKSLEKLIRSKNVEDRAKATTLITEAANPALGDMLLPLLQDGELKVKNAALRAAAKTKNPVVYRDVISALGSPQTRSLAFNALTAGGNEALPEIIHSLEDESLHRRIHLRLIRACSSIKSDAAIRVLEGLISHRNANIRSRALTALRDCRFQPGGESLRRVGEQVRAEFRRAAWLLACQHDLEKSSKTDAVMRAANQDIEETIQRLFLLFGFMYEPRAIMRAQKAIKRRDVNRRSYAIEVVDTRLSQAHKTPFIALLEGLPPKERLERMGAEYKQQPLPPAARLMDVLNNDLAKDNPWLVATAIEAANDFGILAQDNSLQALAGSSESLVLRMVEQVKSEETMLTTVERVIILKSLSMFADTPDEALAELADLLQEVECHPGEVIVREGEAGDSLYIVVSGRVEVVDGERVLNQLGARAVFGELSLLDSSPRTATIRAVEETSLLRLDQTPFYEIMSDYVEVAMGTIQMLTRNLRARTSDVLELSRMLGQ